jgi:hypothetical protein
MKNFTLFIVFTIVATTLFAQKENVDIYKATTTPVLDGVEDDVWKSIDPVIIEKPLFPADMPTPAEASFKALWNDTALFVLVKYDDDDHFPFYEKDGSAGYENYNMDHVEVYIDVNDELNDGKGPNDGDGNYSVDPGFEADSEETKLYAGGWAGHTANRYWAYKLSGEGYLMEIAIPFAENLVKNNDEDFVPEIDKVIGFDVVIVDRDEYSADLGRQRLMWQNDNSTDEGDPWMNMDNCGTLTFKGAPSTTGLHIIENKKLSVYPNPALEVITVNSDFERVTITDVTGRKVLQTSEKSINISTLNKGVYCITLYSNNQLIGVSKFIKQ